MEAYQTIPADYALQPPEKIANTPSEYIQLTEDGYTLNHEEMYVRCRQKTVG